LGDVYLCLSLNKRGGGKFINII